MIPQEDRKEHDKAKLNSDDEKNGGAQNAIS